MSKFIPKQYKKESTTIRMDFDKLKKVDEIAAQYGLSRNELINQCIDYALEHIDSLSKND